MRRIMPFGREHRAAPEPARTGLPQEWGLALLLAVQPSDRALAGWALSGQGAHMLTRLANEEDPYRD